ncbi:hypothetical protein CN550_22555 [Bacillus pseudomycoides]|nr:hypothetical protein CN550_22555 [Bacillus pseudomycoides]PGC41272.1 hypothetical protein COM14_28255 [Bacillus pseudomycoides]PHB23394.1 hypothetical protein COE85_08730 [Bacillus pseudomycoides]
MTCTRFFSLFSLGMGQEEGLTAFMAWSDALFRLKNRFYVGFSICIYIVAYLSFLRKNREK